MKEAIQRPRSLRQVANAAQSALQSGVTGQIDGLLREFLDEFYSEPDARERAAMLQDEPALSANPRADAYLAAAAEHLALRNRLEVPDWAGRPARFLRQPWFPCGLESLKAILLVESPTAFRRRMIFVGADPLYRPRRDKTGLG